MNVELTLGKDLKIRTYPQYAFVDAILNNDKTNSNILCSIHIEDGSKFDWDYKSLNASAENMNGDIVIRRNGLGVKSTGGFYCRYDDFNEITFNLSYMQYTNFWDNISFFYTSGDMPTFITGELYDYNFQVFCCGSLYINTRDERKFFVNNIYEKKVPGWYRIKKQDDTIILFSSFDGKKWTKLNSVTVFDTQTLNSYIGFNIRMNNNQYHKWLCNNFIQIKFNVEDGKKVDYVGLMNRDCVNFSINPLIKFTYEKKDIIKKRGLWNYIKENIDENRYLQIMLNEYYIEGLEAFNKKNYNHESLIYGYDTKKKRVSIMSFLNGSPVFIKLSVRTLELAWEKAVDNNYIIYGLEFLPRINEYSVDIKHISDSLHEYMDGKNSSENYGYIAEIDNGFFGYNMYDKIINNDRERKLFLSDVRIPFLIKEHKECMMFRIQYLYEYGSISEKNYVFIFEMIKKIVDISNVILGLMLKNRVADSVDNQERIWKYLGDLAALEEKCYKLLISELNDFLEKK